MKTLIGLSITAYMLYMTFDIKRKFKTLDTIDNIKANQELEDLLKRSNND